MKKILIRTMAVFLIMVSLTNCSTCKNEKTNTVFENPLIGTWQICNADGIVNNNLYGRNDETSYKIFSSKNFSVFSLHLVDRKVIKSFLGSYTVDNETIIESVEYRSYGYPLISNQKYTYKYKIENGVLSIQGIDNRFKEFWKKIK